MFSDRETNKHDFFKANKTGFQGRDPISVKKNLSGNDYLQTPKTNKQLFTAITIWRVFL